MWWFQLSQLWGRMILIIFFVNEDMRCDRKIPWMFKFLKIHYCQGHIAMYFLQNIPSSFSTQYQFCHFLKQFLKSSSVNVFLVLLWLLWCPELMQNAYLSWLFCLCWRVRSRMGLDLVGKVGEDTQKYFYNLPFCPMVHSNSIHHIFYFQKCFHINFVCHQIIICLNLAPI